MLSKKLRKTNKPTFLSCLTFSNWRADCWDRNVSLFEFSMTCSWVELDVAPITTLNKSLLTLKQTAGQGSVKIQFLFTRRCESKEGNRDHSPVFFCSDWNFSLINSHLREPCLLPMRWLINRLVHSHLSSNSTWCLLYTKLHLSSKTNRFEAYICKLVAKLNCDNRLFRRARKHFTE